MLIVTKCTTGKMGSAGYRRVALAAQWSDSYEL